MTGLEFILLCGGLAAAYLIVDRLHDRWAIRSAMREADALRLRRLRDGRDYDYWTDK